MKKIILLFLPLFLTACGFHLRGNYHLNYLHNAYVSSATTYSPLANGLRDELVQSGVTLAKDASSASIIIQLSTDKPEPSNTGIISNQASIQLNVSESASFTITDNKGKVLQEQHTVSASRQFIAQSNKIISDTNQAPILYKSIRRELITDIMEQLASEDTKQALLKK